MTFQSQPQETARQYYATEWVQQSLVDQCRLRYLTVRFPFGLRRHYSEQEFNQLNLLGVDLWRPILPKPFFELHSAGLPSNPTHVDFYSTLGAVEFIPEVSTVYDLDRTSVVIIDLDPKDPVLFPFEVLRDATATVHAAVCTRGSPLDSQFGIQAVKFRFSGNRSFHIYIQLKRPFPFIDLREVIKTALNPAVRKYPQLSYAHRPGKDNGPAPTNYILVDIGALARHRCVRALWSLHAKTGLVCVPVMDLYAFDKAAATIESVLKTGTVNELF